MGWFLNKRFRFGPRWLNFGFSITQRGIKPTARVGWWTWRHRR